MNYNIIKFKEAEEIMETQEYSQFVKINECKRIIFHPRFLGNTRKGIEEALKSERNLVSDKFGGALIAYNNIKIQQAMGLIVDPYIHFDIVADFIVFKPEVGASLKGVVHRVFKNHVSLLVYGIFNVSIKKSESNAEQLREGNEVDFKVERIYVNNRILSMHGVLWSEEVTKKTKMTKKKSQRKTFPDEDESVPAEESLDRKDKAADRLGELDGEDVEMIAEDSLPVTHKKSEKKKKKKSKEKV
ncbi:DNA-directed RNA polymerase I subunit RPA43-like [Saccostrea echinata]|uniref:DNA-directed RNA polymerase I subunit RPA43-like n=1 Tax=Saccostrea echinata TaxID=191078 RepID=UPI002A7F98CF|nr:DNA-directed RNA polymerase I subunit RPA43-like [Saccostrea echinata]